MEAVIAYPQSEDQKAALTAVLKVLNIPYELEGERPYNLEFVARILAEKEAGNYKVIPMKDL